MSSVTMSCTRSTSTPMATGPRTSPTSSVHYQAAEPGHVLYNTGPIRSLSSELEQPPVLHVRVAGGLCRWAPAWPARRATSGLLSISVRHPGGQRVHSLPGGVRVFAGARRGFYVDLGSIFDLAPPALPAVARVRHARLQQGRARGERHQRAERAFHRPAGADRRADRLQLTRRERPAGGHRRVDHRQPAVRPGMGRRPGAEHAERSVPAGLAAR
jgi:hypothetical protein